MAIPVGGRREIRLTADAWLSLSLGERENSNRYSLIDSSFCRFPTVGQTRPMSRGCDAFRPRPRRSVGCHRIKNAIRPKGAWRSSKGDAQGGTPWAAFGLHPLQPRAVGGKHRPRAGARPPDGLHQTDAWLFLLSSPAPSSSPVVTPPPEREAFKASPLGHPRGKRARQRLLSPTISRISYLYLSPV